MGEEDVGEAADEEVVEKSAKRFINYWFFFKLFHYLADYYLPLLEDDVWREETSGRPSPTWQSLRRLPRDSPGGGMWLLSPSLEVERRW